MHHTVCPYVVDTATFGFTRRVRREDPRTISQLTTRHSRVQRNPTRCPDRNAPAERTGATYQDASATHHTRSIMQVRPPERDRTRSTNARRDASTDECARTRATSARNERTDGFVDTTLSWIETSFFSRRHRAAPIGASRDRDS